MNITSNKEQWDRFNRNWELYSKGFISEFPVDDYWRESGLIGWIKYKLSKLKKNHDRRKNLKESD